MTWDGDAEQGVQRALAALSHDIATPLTALYTFLRLAKGEGLEPIRRCADRIQASTEFARELAELDDTPGTTNMTLAFESAAARLGIAIEVDPTGDVTAQLATARAVLCARSMLRAVVDASPDARITARIARDKDRVVVRVGPAIEPTSWRVVEPSQTGTGFKLAVWGAAVAARGGVVRVGEFGGQIMLELDIPGTPP